MSTALSKQSILISGAAYTGKTYVSAALRVMGYRAIDADDVNGLGEWRDQEGNAVSFIPDAPAEWFIDHAYYWKPDQLAKFLQEWHAGSTPVDGPVLLFGFAGNIFTPDILNLFDRRYYLHTNHDLMKNRLRAADDRKNPFGKTEEQQHMMLSYLEEFQGKFADHGFLPLNAALLPEQILQDILS